MKYLCLLYVAEDQLPPPGTQEFAKVRAANLAANEAMARAGVLVGSGPLQPVRSATTVKIRNGQTLVNDGPFAELQEQIGGYYLIECADLDEAIRWASAIPAAVTGTVEIRPVVKVEGRD